MRDNLVRVVEHYTDLPVLGVLQREDEIGISERHLGLMPSNEADDAESWIEGIRARIADAGRPGSPDRDRGTAHPVRSPV